MERPSGRVLAAFGAVVVLGGTNIVVVPISNEELAPFWNAGLRFLIAGLLLGAAGLAMKLPWPRGASLLGAVLYGLLGFGLSYAFAYWSLLGISSGVFAVLIAVVPLLSLLLAWLHGLEAFNWRATAAALTVVVGVSLIVREQLSLEVHPAYLAAALLGAVAVAESTVAAKFFPRSHPITTNAVGMACGTLLLLVLSVLVGEPQILPRRTSTLVILAYLILLGSVVLFVLLLYVLGRWTVSAVSYQMVLAPLVAIVLAAIFRDERVTWSFVLGALIVLGGVYVAITGRGGPTRAPRQSAASTTDGPIP